MRNEPEGGSDRAKSEDDRDVSAPPTAQPAHVRAFSNRHCPFISPARARWPTQA